MVPEFKIEEKEEIRVIGYKIETTNEGNEGYKRIPEFWKKCEQEEKIKHLFPLMNTEIKGILGVNAYNVDTQDGKRFDYYIAVASSARAPEGMEEYLVPKALWSIFPCTRKNMSRTEVNIITKWLPETAYAPANDGYQSGDMKATAPDIEYYGPNDEIAIWCPVKPRT